MYSKAFAPSPCVLQEWRARPPFRALLSWVCLARPPGGVRENKNETRLAIRRYELTHIPINVPVKWFWFSALSSDLKSHKLVSESNTANVDEVDIINVVY